MTHTPLMLLDLSVKLLEGIGAQLTQSDHASLRAVCKDLDNATRRLFFSLLVLKIDRKGLIEDTFERLEALRSGDTEWSIHARTLRIVPVDPRHHVRTKHSLYSDASAELLAAALASLPKVQTFMVRSHVDVSADFWRWAQTPMIAFVNGLTHLDDLQLLNFPSTVNFSTLLVRCGMRRFALKTLEQSPDEAIFYTPPMPPPVAPLASRVLQLEGPPRWASIWRLLRFRAPDMRLAELTTNLVTPELLEYLSSYSGMKKLNLVCPDGGNLNASNRLADTLFEAVLPRHAESLTEFSCPAAYESRFSFGTHNVDVVSLLHKLTKLEMSINAGAVWMKDETLARLMMVSPRGQPAEAEQADIDPVVTLLLKTAAALPALQGLTIRAAERGLGWRRSNVDHVTAVNVAIGNAVEAFRTDVPCAAVVCAWTSTYELRPLSVSETVVTLKYVRTSDWSWLVAGTGGRGYGYGSTFGDPR
ncbi:hypothetical protein C8R45DRAFT_971383, partial [Mycena sanguinolenta]